MTALLILAAFVLLLLARDRPGRMATREELAQARREALDRRQGYAQERRKRFARYAEHWDRPGESARGRVVPFTAEGVVTGRAEYLYGCVQVLVAPTKLTSEGKCPDSVWLDEGRVDVAAAHETERPASAAERAGGPLLGPVPPGR